ncbi:MAG: methionyl-tRNA formyltransferase [Gammaproteobacteria bacterium]|nr:methionyl-tRNA formyltransferase [Gammaproteobacteria bacterium]MBU2477794.1 methionyl-tRNA formyltransferase [Gammaproteobacteria bacterium]
MRIIFAGTPEFAVPSLRALLRGTHQVVAVYTQPDRPAGRGRKLRAGPVKEGALEQKIPVEQPLSLKTPEAQAALAAYAPDLMVVVAYGLILPQAVLDLPVHGCVNVHASLLPRWRGAAPIQRAILAGDLETGVTLMRMEAGLDTGPMLAKTRCPIGPADSAADLHDRLAEIGGELLGAELDSILAGAAGEPQDDALATYASKLEKSEADLDWLRPARELLRQINAFNPWPVAQTLFKEQTLRIWRAEVMPGQDGEPGTVVRAGRDGVDVACGQDCLRLLEVQLPGGRRISAADFSNSQSPLGVRLVSCAAD